MAASDDKINLEEERPAVFQAMDSLLNEFCRFEEERQRWAHERMALENEIETLSNELKSTQSKYDVLGKRHKILQLSLQRLRDEARSSSSNKNSQGYLRIKPRHEDDEKKSPEERNGNGQNSQRKKGDGTPLSIKKKKHHWSATLPASIDPQRLVELIRDFGSNWQANATNGASTIANNNAGSGDPQKNGGVSSVASMVGGGGNSTDGPSSSSDFSEEKRPPESGQSANSGKKTRKKPAIIMPPVMIKKESLKIHSISLKQHFNSVRCVAFYNDTGMLFTGGDDSLIKVWDVHAIVSGNPSSGSKKKKKNG